MGLHIEIQLDTHIEPVRRLIERQAQRPVPDQCIQVLEQAGIKASRQGMPRQRLHLGQCAQAHARQGRSGLRVKTGAVDGQRRQGLHQAVILHRQTIVDICQHPRRRRVGCRDDTVAKTQFGQLSAQARFEPWPWSEQPQARLDLKQQSAWIIQADLRTELIGPGGEELLVAFLPALGVVGAGEAV
jgi:hypothetical protein